MFGSFSARLSTACALSTPKRGEVPAIFVLGSFSGRLSTACALSTLNRRGSAGIFWGDLFRPVCRPHVCFLPLKGGKCRPFLFWGLFRAVCRPRGSRSTLKQHRTPANFSFGLFGHLFVPKLTFRVPKSINLLGSSICSYQLSHPSPFWLKPSEHRLQHRLRCTNSQRQLYRLRAPCRPPAPPPAPSPAPRLLRHRLLHGLRHLGRLSASRLAVRASAGVANACLTAGSSA